MNNNIPESVLPSTYVDRARPQMFRCICFDSFLQFLFHYFKPFLLVRVRLTFIFDSPFCTFLHHLVGRMYVRTPLVAFFDCVAHEFNFVISALGQSISVQFKDAYHFWRSKMLVDYTAPHCQFVSSDWDLGHVRVHYTIYISLNKNRLSVANLFAKHECICDERIGVIST